MLTRALGVDIQAIAMTMLGLVALYLILRNPTGLNIFVRSIGNAWAESLVVLQGRNPQGVLR